MQQDTRQSGAKQGTPWFLVLTMSVCALSMVVSIGPKLADATGRSVTTQDSATTPEPTITHQDSTQG